MKVKDFIKELQKLDQEREIRVMNGEATEFGDIDYMAFNIRIEKSFTYDDDIYYLLEPDYKIIEGATLDEIYEESNSEELSNYITWIANKRGYLHSNFSLEGLGPEYTYEQYLKEKGK